MNTCSVCNKINPLRFITHNEKIYCDNCSHNCIVGICNVCNSNVGLEVGMFRSKIAKCFNCTNRNNRILDEIISNINVIFQEFKNEFPLFRNSGIFSDDEFNLFMGNFSTFTNIQLSLHEFLNSNEYNFLSINQVIILSKYIEDNVQYGLKTNLYHILIPCIFDIYGCIRNENVHGKDRFYYYHYQNKDELFYVWTYCRLSRSPGGILKNECYLCLEDVEIKRGNSELLGVPIVPSFETKMIQCLQCGIFSHRECSLKLKKCGICRNQFNSWKNYVDIYKQHMLMYIPDDLNIKYKLEYTKI